MANSTILKLTKIEIFWPIFEKVSYVIVEFGSGRTDLCVSGPT